MCAIVGIFGNENASRLASLALFSMQHRGQEATGISSSCNGKIYTKKNSAYKKGDLVQHKSYNFV